MVLGAGSAGMGVVSMIAQSECRLLPSLLVAALATACSAVVTRAARLALRLLPLMPVLC